MADFDRAVAVVLAHEGGFSCDPDDPGGATNFGITLRAAVAFWPNDRVDVAFMRRLSRADALAYYRAAWWERHGFGHLADQAVATKVFDFAVNAGPRAAALVLQRACGRCGPAVLCDGIFGPATFSAANGCPAGSLLAGLGAEMAAFYRRLVEARPRSEKFLAGWLRRAAWPEEGRA